MNVYKEQSHNTTRKIVVYVSESISSYPILDRGLKLSDVELGADGEVTSLKPIVVVERGGPVASCRRRVVKRSCVRVERAIGARRPSGEGNRGQALGVATRVLAAARS